MENKELQKKREDEKFCPEKIGSYFRVEWKVLLTITISGLIYNLGLLAEPWFEGKDDGNAGGYSERQRNFCQYAVSCNRLCGSNRDRTGIQICQTFLCTQVCK